VGPNAATRSLGHPRGPVFRHPGGRLTPDPAPTGHGGLGLRSAVDHSAACYFASVRRCADLDKYEPSDLPDYPAHLSTFEPHLVELKGRKLQEFLSSIIDKEQLEGLLGSRPNLGEKARVEDDQRRARLRSCSGVGAMDWHTGAPSEATGATMRPKPFSAAVAFCLGLPLNLPATCGACGKKQDQFGNHAVTCPNSSIVTHAPHNAIRE